MGHGKLEKSRLHLKLTMVNQSPNNYYPLLLHMRPHIIYPPQSHASLLPSPPSLSLSEVNVPKMSCNGCRILRKGCSDNCMLRQCLQWIDTPQAQAHATVFVAKFFGRACLMSFISNVADCQRPALFQSLLYEAVGRTVNPVNGVVGLLQTGNWHVCQAAVETVLRGGTLRAIPEFVGGEVSNVAETSDVDHHHHRHHGSEAHGEQLYVSPQDLDLCLTASLNARMEEVGGGRKRRRNSTTARETTPSEESETTTLGSNYYSSGGGREAGGDHQRKTLKLFVS